MCLGHINHGKTSLIDCINNENTASYEADSITQSSRTKTFKYKGMKLSFIDTPGHSLFSEIRLNCLKVSNIAVLVVSLQEGIKPQTLECVRVIKQLDMPIVVVYNKLDCDIFEKEMNIMEIREGLTKVGINAGLMGENLVEVQVSTKSNENIKQLLDYNTSNNK